MANTVLKQSVQKSEKGQRTQTVSQQNLERRGTNVSTQAASTDTATGKSAISIELEFTLRFSNQTPVTPEGETEPTPSC